MYIGIDLGGTNIAAALVSAEGNITKRASVPTDRHGGLDAVLGGMRSVCIELLGGTEAPHSIGIGVPGAVNNDTGEVIFTPNLPLSGVNLAQMLRKDFGLPIYLGNDANCAALGETIAGGAKGARNVVFITLGTGVGGGIVIDGKLYTGVNGAAGELGHLVIISGGRECGCGRKGCWETYASASGLNRTAIEFMRTHDKSELWELCGGQPEKVDGRIVFAAYRDGDAAAKLAVEQYIMHLAAGAVSIINVFQPEMFCVGGGISNAWDCFGERLIAAIGAEVYTRTSANTAQTKITKAALGNDAGIIGAALLGR